MTLQPESKRELKRIAGGTALCTAAMWVIFADVYKRQIMPLYGDLKFRDKLEYITNYSVPVGWRSQYCGLFKACLLYTSRCV